jgi:hypothetical protein
MIQFPFIHFFQDLGHGLRSDIVCSCKVIPYILTGKGKTKKLKSELFYLHKMKKTHVDGVDENCGVLIVSRSIYRGSTNLMRCQAWCIVYGPVRVKKVVFSILKGLLSVLFLKEHTIPFPSQQAGADVVDDVSGVFPYFGHCFVDFVVSICPWRPRLTVVWKGVCLQRRYYYKRL